MRVDSINIAASHAEMGSHSIESQCDMTYALLTVQQQL